jgi:hypothetical protein
MTPEQACTKEAQDFLVGKTIKAVSYLSKKEAKALGWYSRSIVIEFTDGSLAFPSRDDEGNDAGALFGQSIQGDDITIPVIR